MKRSGKLSPADESRLDDYFDALDRMGEGELLRMKACWRSIGKSDHEDAWTMIRVVAARDGLSPEIDRVRDRAIAWVSNSAGIYPYTFKDPLAWNQIKREAVEAIVDVALAQALGDRLDEKTRVTLLAPWGDEGTVAE